MPAAVSLIFTGNVLNVILCISTASLDQFSSTLNTGSTRNTGDFEVADNAFLASGMSGEQTVYHVRNSDGSDALSQRNTLAAATPAAEVGVVSEPIPTTGSHNAATAADVVNSMAASSTYALPFRYSSR